MFVLATAALLPALVLASSAEGNSPVIQDVTAQLSDTRIAAEVVTTGPLFREDVRVKLDGKTLVIYLTGAVIDGGKRTFGEGESAIRALPRATYSKLEVPLPANTTCAGPASIDVDETIVRVGMACGTGGGSAGKVGETAQRRPDRRPEALAARLEAMSPPVKAVSAPKAAEPAKAAPPLPVIEATPPPAASPVITPVVKDKEIHAAIPEVKPLPAERTSPFVIVGALSAMGIAGYLLWRRRRDQQFGMIRILETASLGPKRALIVAEIDGEKMILGTSEAGISVLTPAPRSPWNEHTVGGTRIPMPPDMGEATLTDQHIGPRGYAMAAAGALGGGGAVAMAADRAVAVEDNEGGLLARLFRRRDVEIEVTEAEEEPLGNMEDEFRDLLADSIEDEDLRRRLQAGLGGRTS
jgi:flagellar biogenesis protein FliO